MTAMAKWMRGALAAMLALGVATAGACGKKEDNGKMKVVATIFAYYDIARAVGGDKVQVEILLDPNTSPHEYKATPEDKEKIDDAKLVIKNGLALDDWPILNGIKAEVLVISKFAKPKGNPEEVSVDGKAEPAATAAGGGGGHRHDHDHGAVNPHIWLDPTVQIAATEAVRDALARLDPANKATYDANAAKYIADLKTLDADFAAAAKTFSKKDFIGFHAAYDYLAERYGLEEVAAISEVTGGITPDQVDKVIGLIKSKKATVVFAEDAFGKDAVEKITRQTGATLGVLQPLETYKDKNDTYISLMRENLEQMKKAMK